MVAIAQMSDKTVLPVFVRPEIKTWSDLEGKKLAADAVDTAFALVLRRVLLAHGLDMAKGDYELVALGTTGARLESMIKVEIFAGVLNSPFDGKALDAGMRRIGDSRDVLPDYPNTIFALARVWGEQNRDIVAGFLRAWLKSAAWVKDPTNRDAAAIVARAQGLFAAERLEVESTVTPNSTDQMRGLSQGKYDIVSTAFDNVLAWSGPAVELGVALLPPEALDLGDGQPVHADVGQGLAHFVHLNGLMTAVICYMAFPRSIQWIPGGSYRPLRRSPRGSGL